MIPLQDALDKVLSTVKPLGAEQVSISEALGRVCANDIVANRDLPAFDHSGMDGYAVRFEDIQGASIHHPARLEVVEEVPAGFIPKKRVEKNRATRIMTGAPIPEGADTVVPVEDTKQEDGFVLIFTATSRGEHIRKAGEEVRKGEPVLAAGDRIDPADIGTLASLGRSFVAVYQRAIVAILCTGEELVDVDGDLNGAKVVSSNAYSLAAQVKECGAIPLRLGIARDRKEEIKEKFLQGLRADMLISSAGVSMGDYDLVKDVLTDLGMETIFWKVAMKPGMPVVYGTLQGKPVFALPGNPVSSMVTFEQLVRPSLLKMMGHRNLFRPVIDAVLNEEIRKSPGRVHFIRALVAFEKGRSVVVSTGRQGSGIVKSVAKANGLMVIPEDREIVKAGETVKVQLLDRNF